jgi:hypothetical protein
MSGEIINRDGNLVEVDFSDKNKVNSGNKVAGAAMSGVAMGAIIPILAIGGATPFLNPDNNDKPEADKSMESRLPNNPYHTSKSAQDIAGEYCRQKALGASYVERLATDGETPGKTR